jgi:hypothetical protein
MPLLPAIDLDGRLDLEGGGDRPAAPRRVKLSSGDTPRIPGQPHAEVRPDGSFTIRNVVPGIWDIAVEPIPNGGYLKAMRLGDQDVFAEEMAIMPETRTLLRIVVSTRGAAVKGTVTVPPGVTESARATVLLAPDGKYEQVSILYVRTDSDEAGRFEFRGVTPGRYKLYAFESLDLVSWRDPQFLAPLADSSEAFEVREGGSVSRQVALIPADTGSQ